MYKHKDFHIHDWGMFLFDEESEMLGEVWLNDDELSKVELIV